MELNCVDCTTKVGTIQEKNVPARCPRHARPRRKNQPLAPARRQRDTTLPRFADISHRGIGTQDTQLWNTLGSPRHTNNEHFPEPAHQSLTTACRH